MENLKMLKAKWKSLELLTDWNQLSWSKIPSTRQQYLLKVVYVSYKLAHGYNFLVYFEIGKSTIYLVSHDFLVTMNIVFKRLISWLMGSKMQNVLDDFK